MTTLPSPILDARLLDIFNSIPLANRNYIVDGNFDSWTNSTATVSATASGYNGAAMYRSFAGTGGAATVTQTAFNGSDALGMTSPAITYYQYVQTTASTGTVAASTAPYIYQPVESGRTLHNRYATYSTWLWTASGTLTIPNVLARQQFGAPGTTTSLTVIDPAANWVVGTTPTRFSVLVKFPSTTGILPSTAGVDHVQIGLWLPSNQTFTLNTTQWQLEQSSPYAPATVGLPTAFEYRGPDAELERVRRMYKIVIASARYYSNATSIAFDTTVNWSDMRTNTPTSSVYVAGNTSNMLSGYPKLLDVTSVGGRFEIAANAATTDTYAIDYYYAIDSRY